VKCTVHEGQYTFLIVHSSVFRRMKNISDKSCRENINIQFMFNNFFFENLIFYEIRLKNIVEHGRPQMIIRSMRIAWWIPKATNTHIQVV
jgi:hypothetical protein